MSLTERKKFLSARSWAEIQTSTINYHAAKLFHTCRSCSSNRANLNLPQRANVWLFNVSSNICKKKTVVNLRGQLQGVFWKSSENFINLWNILTFCDLFCPLLSDVEFVMGFYIFQTISKLDRICLRCLAFEGSNKLRHGWKGCKMQLIFQLFPYFW